MFVANSSAQIATRFLEEGINSSGTLTRAARVPNKLTNERARAVNTIKKMAIDSGLPVGIVLSKVVSQSIPELQAYVQARGEVPRDNAKALAIQAALLRAIEVGTMANAIDTYDSDALQLIEESEQQAIEDNTADASHVLRPDTAAAVTLLINRISDRYKQKGGSGNMADFVNDMRKSSGASNFDSVCCGEYANNATGGFIYYTPGQEENTIGTVTDPAQPADGGGSFWDNLFNGIDKTVDAITKVTGAVQTTTTQVQNTTGGILDTIKGIGSDVGSDSIQKYMSENWLKIVAVIIGIILLTIIVARASRNR